MWLLQTPELRKPARAVRYALQKKKKKIDPKKSNKFTKKRPDVAYRDTDPGDGKEMIVELKFINMGPSRYENLTERGRA